MSPSLWRQARLAYQKATPIMLRNSASPRIPLVSSPEGLFADSLERNSRGLTWEYPELTVSTGAWRLTKSDTLDHICARLPKEFKIELVQAELMENLIVKAWADVIVGENSNIQLTKSVATLIDQKIGSLFHPLDAPKDWKEEFLDLRYRFLRTVWEGEHQFCGLGWISTNGWPLHYTMALLERMEEIRAAGELDAALLRPIHTELLHWFPLILARLEELAAEPGPTSQRLANAISTMRDRIPRLRALQVAAK